MTEQPTRDRDIVEKTLIILLLIGLALLLVPLRAMMLLIFAAVLLGVLFRAVGAPFLRFGLNDTVAVLCGFFTIVALLGGFGYLFGATLSVQFANLSAQLPHAIQVARGALAHLPFGGTLAASTPNFQSIFGQTLSFAFGAVGATTDFILVLIGAVYLAIQPALYVRGVQLVFPQRLSAKVAEAMTACGQALHNFLLGQFSIMAIDGFLVFVGLSLIGMPSAAALGLFLGLANFVPLLGPIVGAVPGILVGLTQGPAMGVKATLVYLVIQQLEGNILTPLIQRRAVSIPPAVLIFSLAGLGSLFGTIGVVVSAPLTVVIFTMVAMLWTRDALGHNIVVPGSHEEHATAPKSTSR